MGTETELVGADHEVNARASRGITLVETLVAFAIVSVTFVIVLDTFLTTNRATQAAERRAAVADALSYVLADMAREAQVSGDFSSQPGKWIMQRHNMEGISADEVRYEINNSTIYKKVGAGDQVRLLPPNVTIKDYSLSLHTLPLGSPKRMFVTFSVYHTDDASSFNQPVYIQTQFTERD